MSSSSSLSRRIAQSARSFRAGSIDRAVESKVKIALLDMLSCVFESLDHPTSRLALKFAARHQGGPAAVIGTPLTAAAPMAALVNAILAHGLVREDMHTASVSHLGVVVFPTLLALAQQQIVSGAAFLAAAVCGYEAGAATGRALMDAETVRLFRPTGITGPIGAAVAGGVLWDFDEETIVSALGLAVNSTGGFNEWPRHGADEMYFHAGFAARSAVTAVELAQLGARASETALDGPAGLFAALRRPEAAGRVAMFSQPQPEIMEVYHKPAPACNYAQTACQAALALVERERIRSGEITAVDIRVSSAAVNYPGCNAAGPFERVLQAKMSIQFCVAATLVRGAIEERSYRLLDDPEILRLAGIATLAEDAEFTRAYPAAQGTEVSVTLQDGRRIARRLPDLTPASADQIRERFRASVTPVLGRVSAEIIEATIDNLEDQEDAGVLNALLAAR